MSYQNYILSPLSQTKKKISDNARRLATTKIVLLIITTVFYIILVALVYLLLSLLGGSSESEIMSFASTMIGLLPLLLFAGIALLVTGILNYVYFFMLGSSLNSLRTAEPSVSEDSKKASMFLLIGLILQIVGPAVFASITPTLTVYSSITSTVLLGTSFFYINRIFKNLKSQDRFPGNDNKLLIASQVIMGVSSIVQIVMNYITTNKLTSLLLNSDIVSMNDEEFLELLTGSNLLEVLLIYFGPFLIAILVLNIISAILLITGLYRLGKDAREIVDPSPQTSPYAPYGVQQVHDPSNPYHTKYGPVKPSTPNQIYSPSSTKKPQQSQDTLSTNKQFCPNCGNDVQIDSRFCEGCGYKLHEG